MFSTSSVEQLMVVLHSTFNGNNLGNKIANFMKNEMFFPIIEILDKNRNFGNTLVFYV